MSATLTAASCPPPAYVKAADQDLRGKIGKYAYEMWNQNYAGEVEFTPEKDGTLKLKASGIENILLTKGTEFESRIKYKLFGKITASYDIDFSFSDLETGNAQFGIYGWAESPTTEYYIVEARLGINWDRNLSQYGKGLQVTHVDYQSSAWNGNRVNSNANHQRMTIIAANNDYHGSYFSGPERLNAWKGNLYPYIVSDENGIVVCNDSLTANSTPAAKVFSTSGLMPHTLSRIALSEDELQVSFLFDGEHYDAIHELSSEAASEFSDGYWHDLSGRRVAVPWRPGIYVRGGRKVVVTK